MALLGRDHVAQVDELAGACEADAQCEALRAPEPRDEAEIDLGLPEPRPLRGDDQVAGERQLAPAAKRDAVERRDDRHVELFETREHVVPEARVRVSLGGAHGRHGGDVRTRREGLVAGAREHDGAHVAGAADVAHRARQLAEGRRVERVQRRGPVQRDGDDRVRPRHDEVGETLVGHLSTPAGDRSGGAPRSCARCASRTA